MTLRKLIENTTADSSPSWTIQSITFIAGWWRFLPTAILPCSAITPTPRPANRANHNARPTIGHRALALGLCAGLLPGGFSYAAPAAPQSPATVRNVSTTPQDTTHKKKKAAEPKSPALNAATPEDAAAQKELALLARDVHQGIPGSYEKLASFANKNSASVWGQRAALALGYEEYSHAHAQQALVWLQKAKADTLLYEYTLFWTAQSEHALNKNSAAIQDFTTLLKDYPNTAIKEQVLEAYVPAAVESGRPQDGLDALAAYPAASSKPGLLLERARANEAARHLVPAAKDYQTLYYKFPLADEAHDAGTALPRLNKQLHSEFPYATGELQDQRAQDFYDAHQWKEARAEYEKLAAMLKDPANPTRQRALVRIAECRQHPKPSIKLLASLKVSDPEVDAERLYTLSQADRSEKHEAEMLAAIEKIWEKYPQSRWAEEALMTGGNYYWVELERSKALSY